MSIEFDKDGKQGFNKAGEKINEHTEELQEKADLLFEAIRFDDMPTASKLLREIPQLANALNDYEQTGFWQAACRGRHELIQQMLEEPIASILDPFRADFKLRDALEVAQHYGHTDVVELLESVFGVEEREGYNCDPSHE